jgi:hypothetical protein
MISTVTLLYDSDGQPRCVQLTHDEYVRLDQIRLEAPLLRVQLKHVMDVLSSGDALPEYPLPAVGSLPEPVEAAAVQPCAEEEPQRPPAGVSVAGTPVSPADAGTIAISPPLQAFLNEQDPSQKIKSLLEGCARTLSCVCERRITLSLQKPFICLWDFDAWTTFAYGEVICGDLYLSVEKSNLPEARASDIWTPPGSLSKVHLARMKVDAVTDTLIARLRNALMPPGAEATGTGL